MNTIVIRYITLGVFAFMQINYGTVGENRHFEKINQSKTLDINVATADTNTITKQDADENASVDSDDIEAC